MTQPDQAPSGYVVPRSPAWRLRFGLRTLFFGVAAVAIALGWSTRTDRFYNSPQVYAFQLAGADGRPLRGAVAFVRQHRLFAHLRRLQFVIFIDTEPDETSPDEARADLEMEPVGDYRINYLGGCRQLWIPDFRTPYRNGLSMCVDASEFGTGAVHEVAGKHGPDSDRWQTIVGGSFTLAIQTKPLTLTWDELLEFVDDPSVDRWTFDTAHRWKSGRN